jgi:hypothetical protein
MCLQMRHREVQILMLAWFLAVVVCLGHSQAVNTTSVADAGPNDGSGASRKPASPSEPSLDLSIEASPEPVALRPIPSLTPVIQPAPPTRFQWRPAINQSFRFLIAQHAFRFMTEQGTRSELKGPFFRDYVRSVSDLDHWNDGDPFFVNYIGHPMMGSVTGYIQRQNDPKFQSVNIGRNANYWKSVVRSFAFSAVYSTQFEIGPLSESSLGNSGKNPGTQGFVDLVVTPTIGTGWMIGEDALDRYLIRRLERATSNPWIRLAVRTGLNPTRSFANLMRGKVPWHRDDREGVSRQALAAPAAAGSGSP